MTNVSMRLELTPKQESFCQYYLALKHGTNAAIKAGYSPDTAYSIASENLNKPEIKARIAELQAQKPVDSDIADALERRKILSRIVRMPVDPDKITPAHILQAADLMNKQEGLYQDTRNEVNFASIKILLVEGNNDICQPVMESPEAIETSGHDITKIVRTTEANPLPPCQDTQALTQPDTNEA